MKVNVDLKSDLLAADQREFEDAFNLLARRDAKTFVDKETGLLPPHLLLTWMGGVGHLGRGERDRDRDKKERVRKTSSKKKFIDFKYL